MHLELFRGGYLPIGAVRVLAKATNLITVTAFALLLLWFVERYAGLRLSRVIFLAGVLVVGVSAFFLYARRDSYRTEKENVVLANLAMVARHPPAILLPGPTLPPA